MSCKLWTVRSTYLSLCYTSGVDMEVLSNKGKRCFFCENNKLRSYRKDQEGTNIGDRMYNKWTHSTSDDVEWQHTEEDSTDSACVSKQWTVCRNRHAHQSLNLKRHSLLLLHTSTIADRDRFLQEWATWPMIANWSPTLAQDNCFQLTRGRWLSTEHTAVLGRRLLQPLPQEFGTVCRQT